MTARNHHFVSQAYLAGFGLIAGDKTKITGYDLSEEREFTTVTRNVAACRDFNRINSDIDNPNFVEELLGDFEGSIKPAIRQIQESQLLSEDTLSVLLTMMALYYIRNPAVRDRIHSHHEKVMNLTLQQAAGNQERFQSILKEYEAEGFDPSGISREGVLDVLKNGEFSLEQDREFLIDIEFQQIIPISKVLAVRKWDLLLANSTTGNFITSDRPVSIEWFKPDDVPPMFRSSPGLAHKTTIIFFPLSKRVCLTGSYEGYFEDCIVTPEIVAHANSRQIMAASKQIYYTPNEGFNFSANKSVLPHSELSKHLNT